MNCADHANYAKPDSAAINYVDAEIIAPAEVNSTSSMLPSIVQPPKLELKPLSDHIKYVFLAEDEQLPVIVANNLHANQEQKLLQVLSEHKQAIDWTLADTPGISPSTCMHRILLEQEAKPVRQP